MQPQTPSNKDPQKAHFIKLSQEDAQYLLDLIQEMDSDTEFTKQQRSYTVPKLQKILKDPDSKRLAFQDIEYLLELIEDDDLEEFEQQRKHTQDILEQIRSLQLKRFQQIQDIQEQREQRRIKRLERNK